MRVNGFQCDGCGVFTEGAPGDQRDPGPFLPAAWWGFSGGGPCFCPDCKSKIQKGTLKS